MWPPGAHPAEPSDRKAVEPSGGRQLPSGSASIAAKMSSGLARSR